MNIFEKGNFQALPHDFVREGVQSLSQLSSFQKKFAIYDTDTTVNTIRDAIVATYLKFDLLNFEKHGFDAKSSISGHYLEIKQCSYSSETWGGTWNDTNEEKAVAFSDSRLYTVIALWKGASDLQFMVYGQNKALGEHLHRLVVNRKEGSRSTQTISMKKLIVDFGFVVVVPPDKTKVYVNSLITHKYHRQIRLSNNNVKSIHDI